MNKNIHFNLTIVLLGTWLTGLLVFFLIQDEVSLAHEKIHKKNILKPNNSDIEKSINRTIIPQKTSEETPNIDRKSWQNTDNPYKSFDIPPQKTKLKTVTKSDFALPAKDPLPEPNNKTKIVTKSNSELVHVKTLELIREFEGFRPHAYRDTDGTPVIGYGLSKIEGKKVRMGDRIALHQAEAALKAEVHAIQEQIKSIVKVELNSYQLGALTSFAFNTGFYRLKNSTLLRKLNAGDHHGAANEFLRWNKAHYGGRLVPLAGLTRRRRAEKQLFLTSPEP